MSTRGPECSAVINTLVSQLVLTGSELERLSNTQPKRAHVAASTPRLMCLDHNVTVSEVLSSFLTLADAAVLAGPGPELHWIIRTVGGGRGGSSLWQKTSRDAGCSDVASPERGGVVLLCVGRLQEGPRSPADVAPGNLD